MQRSILEMDDIEDDDDDNIRNNNGADSVDKEEDIFSSNENTIAQCQQSRFAGNTPYGLIKTELGESPPAITSPRRQTSAPCSPSQCSPHHRHGNGSLHRPTVIVVPHPDVNHNKDEEKSDDEGETNKEPFSITDDTTHLPDFICRLVDSLRRQSTRIRNKIIRRSRRSSSGSAGRINYPPEKPIVVMIIQ